MGFLLPSVCGACLAPGWVVCPACVAALRPPPAPAWCPSGLDTCRSLLAYEGPARQLVAGLKYRNQRAALRWLVGGLAVVAPSDVDVVTWPPTVPSRRRRRGYDQAELLARGLARRLGIPAARLLVRDPAAGAQTGLGRAARLANAGFVARRRAPPAVLVVDDVTTTGATLSAAAATLRAAGAERVRGLTVAVTGAPARHRRGQGPYDGTSIHGVRGRPGS